jgi:DNA-binding response OmpR family regulator
MTESATVLVVEDDDDVRDLLQRSLTASGFNVRSASDGEAGLGLALDLKPDLIIIDVGLPLRSGVEVTRELRNRGFRAPLLMLTARTSVMDKVTGLDAGADDYLPKPFDHTELMARVRALMRRSAITVENSTLRVRDVTLDPLSHTVERGGLPVDLSQREFALLEFLMRNAGRAVSRNAIADHVWKGPVDTFTNIIDVYVAYLRKKLGDNKKNQIIKTVRGTGYLMET